MQIDTREAHGAKTRWEDEESCACIGRFVVMSVVMIVVMSVVMIALEARTRTRQSLTKRASSHSDTNLRPVFRMLAWMSVQIIMVLSIKPQTRAVVRPNAKNTPLVAMSGVMVN